MLNRKKEIINKQKEHSGDNEILGRNDYRIDEQVVYVKLSNCDEEMICDLDDWNKCKRYTWHKDDKGYPSNGNKKRFHRLILPKKEGKVLDHIKRNKLDNRKVNLRYVNFRTNIINRDSLKDKPKYMIGIEKTKGGKWKAKIGYKRKLYHLGIFEHLEDAISARREAEIKFYGTEL